MSKTKYVAIQRIESPNVSLWPGDAVPDDLPGLDDIAAYAKEHPENAAVIPTDQWEKMIKAEEASPEE